MPWTKSNYPDSMKNLPGEVRNKAIEIANALLREGKMEEDILIPTAISKAKDWAANHGKKLVAAPGVSHSTDVKKHGEDRYVIPTEDGWAVKKEGSKNIEKKYSKKQDALKYAGEEAREAHAGITVQGKEGRIEQRKSFNVQKQSKKG